MNHLSKSLAILGLAGLSIGWSAFAQPSHVLGAHVPFDFQVGGVSQPAGDYQLYNPAASVIQVVNRATGRSTVFMVRPCSRTSQTEGNYLVFHRVGDRYFLSQMWDTASGTGSEVPLSRTEKELAAIPNHQVVAEVKMPLF